MENKNIYYVFGAVLLILLGYHFFLSPPANFPVGVIFSVEPGSGLRAVSRQLKEDHIIRSRTAFEAFVILFGGEKVISAGYYFDSILPVYTVARRISKGEHHIAQTKVTVPEGLNNSEMADIFGAKLITFDKEAFLADALPWQGGLFPDTYYFFMTDSPADVIKAMKGNFEKKIAPLRPEIERSGRTENEIIIMASVIEKEAEGSGDRAVISGILWKRIEKGMPLQVDAAPETYQAKGLPKNPIGNPGVDAILAAIHPQSSPYLYYLHDKQGVTRYARTFEEHRKNIALYLK